MYWSDPLIIRPNTYLSNSLIDLIYFKYLLSNMIINKSIYLILLNVFSWRKDEIPMLYWGGLWYVLPHPPPLWIEKPSAMGAWTHVHIVLFDWLNLKNMKKQGPKNYPTLFSLHWNLNAAFFSMDICIKSKMWDKCVEHFEFLFYHRWRLFWIRITFHWRSFWMRMK